MARRLDCGISELRTIPLVGQCSMGCSAPPSTGGQPVCDEANERRHRAGAPDEFAPRYTTRRARCEMTSSVQEGNIQFCWWIGKARGTTR